MDSPPRTVLIVDSIPASREQYQLLLLQHQHSYTLVEASSGRQGMTLWQQQQPDVILLEYPLPDLDGLTFLAQLRLLTNQLHLPVILLIEQGSEAIAVQAISAGAQTYLLKEQLTGETLRIAIDSTITNTQLRQQLQQSQAALEESESRLKSTLEGSRTEFRWNLQTRQIQWSDNLEPLFGKESGKFNGSSPMFIDRHKDEQSVPTAGNEIDMTDRKQIEEMLRLQAQVLDQTHDTVVSTDLDGFITSWNQGAERILGYRVEEVLGQHISLLYRLETPEFLEHQVIAPLKEKGEHEVEVVVQSKQGDPIHLLLSLSLLRDAYGDPVGMIGFSMNITERKQAEAALRENEQMLQLALTGAGQGIWDWDLKTQGLTWDSRCKEIFGLPSGFPVTYDWHLTALHPDDRQRVQTAATVALNEHTEFVEEYRTFHPNGVVRWILARGCGFYDATGKPYRMSGTVMDITARKQAEIDLQERNEHIRLLYETTRDLLSTDQPLMLIQSIFEDLKEMVRLDVYFNYILNQQQQKLQLISYDGILTEQAQSIEWLDFGVAICGTVAQQRHQIMKTNIQQCTEPKAELVRSLGLTAYCAQPLIAQDKLYGTLSFGSRSRQEFTASEQNLFQAICDQIAIALERSELFSSLQQQTEELIRANRIKDEFLAILSHELRSPLNPILGWAKLLQTRAFDAARTADALATIERNARLQTQLIDDLLDIAKILQGKLNLKSTPVDLVFVIESAIDTVSTAAIAKNIRLHRVLPQIGQVSGDATRLQQVVWNLLSNAIKFTPDNGRVEIWLEHVENQAQITVSDTGKGIKPDFLPYIFESFRQEDTTTTRQYGGLGLGLSIVRHLVEAHGGTIRAESSGEEQGSTFTVRLPLLQLEADRNRSEALREQELNLTGVRVLAVDDEPDTRELLTVLLDQYGAEVLTANSAAEVLANLESFQPDVLVSDIGMPQTDGFALIQQLRALPPEKGGQIPAIALTAYAGQEDYQRAISNGYQRHVTKPLDPQQLVRAVMVLTHKVTE